MNKIISIFLLFLINCLETNALIQDDTLGLLDKNLKIKEFKYEQIIDEYLPKNIQTKASYKNNQTYNFESLDDNTIKLKPKYHYSTKKDLKVGDMVEFILAEKTNLDGKVFQNGTHLKARIENISPNKNYGIPSEITIGNFQIEDKIIDATYEIRGANRYYWLYPTISVANCFFFAGLLLIPIKGGHANLNPKKTYLITY